MARMRQALSELSIVGVATSLPFHHFVLKEEHFQSGKYDINYLENHGQSLLSDTDTDEELRRVALAVALAEHARRGAESIEQPAHSHMVSQSAWLRAARIQGLR